MANTLNNNTPVSIGLMVLILGACIFVYKSDQALMSRIIEIDSKITLINIQLAAATSDRWTGTMEDAVWQAHKMHELDPTYSVPSVRTIQSSTPITTFTP